MQVGGVWKGAGVEVGKWRDVGVGGESVEGCRCRSGSVKDAV